MLELSLPGVVAPAGQRGHFLQKVRSAAVGELHGLVEFELGQPVADVEFVGREVALDELLVVVLLFEFADAAPGQAQEVEDHLFRL